MLLLVPPDPKCESAFHEITLLAKAHALVTDERNGALVIMLPEKQRELDLREKALNMSSMCEVGSEASEDIEVTPVYPQKRSSRSSYLKNKLMNNDPKDDIDLELFSE